MSIGEDIDIVLDLIFEDDTLSGMTSAALIQRKLNWGYTRSRRVFIEMERVGMIASREAGSNLQKILVKKPDITGRAARALVFAVKYGGIDGDHHKAWVIDQMCQVLAGDDYEDMIKEVCKGKDGPNTYRWNKGIAP